MQLTYYGANGWLLELAGLRVLLDPWLVGSLRFAGAGWLFEGSLPQDWPVPEQLDLLLLSQGLPDHAHPETLQLLPKSLPLHQRKLLLSLRSVTSTQLVQWSCLLQPRAGSPTAQRW